MNYKRAYNLLENRLIFVKTIFSCSENDLSWLMEISLVKRVTQVGTTVEVEGTGSFAPLVASALVNHGIVPDDFRIKQPSLEDVFLTITGHQIEE